MQPPTAVMLDIPIPNLTAYLRARNLDPCGVIPMPGEPVMGHVPGILHVRASNGVEQGWYDYWADVFYSDHDDDMPLGLRP